MTRRSEAKPPWIRVPLAGGDSHHHIKKNLRERGLYTVCEEARCPNLGECWSSGTATLMILGEICTRGCRFCAVKSGHPGGLVDEQEPGNCADTVRAMGLSYVVITSVDRDDLADGGAAQFAAVIAAIRQSSPHCRIEVLTGDYQGKTDDLETVLRAVPDVFAHNLETVRSLTPRVRDRRAGYDQSLAVLAHAKKFRPAGITKSSLMLGLGERADELEQAMADLRAVGTDVLTLGQYLRPSTKHLPVVEYLPPERFEHLAVRARELGFLHVSSGPLVRSSYKAGESFLEDYLNRQHDPARAGWQV